MLFSHVKISCFRAKNHLVFHWCLNSKTISAIIVFTHTHTHIHTGLAKSSKRKGDTECWTRFSTVIYLLLPFLFLLISLSSKWLRNVHNVKWLGLKKEKNKKQNSWKKMGDSRYDDRARYLCCEGCASTPCATRTIESLRPYGLTQTVT